MYSIFTSVLREQDTDKANYIFYVCGRDEPREMGGSLLLRVVLSYLTKHVRQRIHRNDYALVPPLPLVLGPLPPDVLVPLLLLLHAAYDVGIHERLVHVQGLTAEGTAKDPYGVEYESRPYLNQGRGMRVSRELLLGVGLLGRRCRLFQDLVVSYPNL